jgi:hypothetical protein
MPQCVQEYGGCSCMGCVNTTLWLLKKKKNQKFWRKKYNLANEILPHARAV